MRLLAALSFGLSLTAVAASPLPPSSITSVLCHLPFLDVLCRRTSNSISMSNVIGVTTHGGVTRYVAKYATANRWSPPEMSTSWISPQVAFMSRFVFPFFTNTLGVGLILRDFHRSVHSQTSTRPKCQKIVYMSSSMSRILLRRLPGVFRPSSGFMEGHSWLAELQILAWMAQT